MNAPIRLAYLVSHPIQYQAPLLRRLAREPGIELTVLFGSDFSVRGYRDVGFGVEVAWDVPLLEGYRYRVLPPLRDNGTVGATTPLSRSLLAALKGLDGRSAFDVLWVHGYASLNALRGILAAHALSIPVLLRAESWSGDRPRAAWKRALRSVFFAGLRPLITATLPIGTQNRLYWRDIFGSGMPQFPVPYAVDNAFFAAAAQAAAASVPELRRQLDLAPDRPVVLFASKLQARKHADHLLEAVAQLHRAGMVRPYLLVAGDGEERDRLSSLAGSLDTAADTRFLGFQNQTQLPALFTLADVFVLPSQHEPWGLIVNEAMAAGCPVVASSDVGAAADLVQDGVTGYVYPVGDVQALASALAAALSSPEHTQSLGAAAAQRMASWDFEADVRGLREAVAFATRRRLP